MVELFYNVTLQYGAVGFLVLVLCYISYLLLKRIDKRDESHVEERTNWMKNFEELIKEGNLSRDNNTRVLSELTTIIKTQQ